jgi:hypothetical protein
MSTPEAEDRLLSGPPDAAEAPLHPVTAAEQSQPRREWRIEQLETETTTAVSRQS